MTSFTSKSALLVLIGCLVVPEIWHLASSVRTIRSSELGTAVANQLPVHYKMRQSMIQHSARGKKHSEAVDSQPASQSLIEANHLMKSLEDGGTASEYDAGPYFPKIPGTCKKTWQQALDEQVFTNLTPLGKGNWGTVFKAQFKGATYAVKEVGKNRIESMVTKEVKFAVPDPTMVCNEVSIGAIHAPFVLRFHDVFIDTTKGMHLTMDFMAGGDLTRSSSFAPEAIRPIMAQVAFGLWSLHQKHVIWRDIKPENILVRAVPHNFADMQVALADFGISAFFQEGKPVVDGGPGSFEYRAPNQKAGQQCGPEVDWWGFGKVVYNLFSGTTVFDLPRLREYVPGDVQQLLHKLITNYDPSLITWRQNLTVDWSKLDEHPILSHKFWLNSDYNKPFLIHLGLESLHGQKTKSALQEFWGAVCVKYSTPEDKCLCPPLYEDTTGCQRGVNAHAELCESEPATPGIKSARDFCSEELQRLDALTEKIKKDLSLGTLQSVKEAKDLLQEHDWDEMKLRAHLEKKKKEKERKMEKAEEAHRQQKGELERQNRSFMECSKMMSRTSLLPGFCCCKEECNYPMDEEDENDDDWEIETLTTNCLVLELETSQAGRSNQYVCPNGYHLCSATEAEVQNGTCKAKKDFKVTIQC
eukprot:gnl/MRDRNA2_/MRDRNA2_112375_c0_seq1.p1 gnl/MRDRNA2_/MRDRNA2_112375_c0~~gnl/MRDRNA2_/MRDRNA2_112375_c0_seq1.p1  ORF type:complete len:642 (+),score=118.86 gnl/MRDRNA2_/MRDRNA2_112375_c0_seq1:107-2032(+)